LLWLKVSSRFADGVPDLKYAVRIGGSECLIRNQSGAVSFGRAEIAGYATFGFTYGLWHRNSRKECHRIGFLNNPIDIFG
jgi:hypothetical protein